MFDNDRMASGKILECVWDPEWHTWIPAPGYASPSVFVFVFSFVFSFVF